MGAVNASRADVARLFGRAAFGATAADLDAWTGRPYAEMVSSLLDVPDPATRLPMVDDARRILIQEGTRGWLDGGYLLQDAQIWWLERMRTTPYPLEERMVLFWHDHWATAWRYDFPDIGMLLIQNETLRQHALGRFSEMCRRMTVDPAMLFWLNGAQNITGAPNENYAREFFELFTLGTMPQVYTEHDIRESARALTGWVCDPYIRWAQFQPANHDPGTKTVLGRTIGNLDSDEYKEVVEAALDQPVAARFVAYKMVLNFAFAPATTNLMTDPDPIIAAVAAKLVATGGNLREAMRTLLMHDDFRTPDAGAGRQAVRQPIELVVGACKALGITPDNLAIYALGRMGQIPFKPPNVGGWPLGRDWLSHVTAIARYDWGQYAYGVVANQDALLPTLPEPADLGAWAALFGLASFSANTAAALQGYIASRPDAGPQELRAGIISLIISSPDWMVM